MRIVLDTAGVDVNAFMSLWMNGFRIAWGRRCNVVAILGGTLQPRVFTEGKPMNSCMEQLNGE